MVYRIYVKKKEESGELFANLQQIKEVTNLRSVSVVNRYDVENIEDDVFKKSIHGVFSEPQIDEVSFELPQHEGAMFAVEYLPGQFDQRADSAAQCIALMSMCERPLVRSAGIYLLEGNLADEEVLAIKKYVINPVESREASLEKAQTLKIPFEVPDDVPIIDGFCEMDAEQLGDMIKEYGFAMDGADIEFCREYFAKERRDPTLTELRMIDTYWSDHCRHTTFLTELSDVKFDDERAQKTYDKYIAARKTLNIKKPVCLMDIGTIAAKYLKSQGGLQNIDESEEINACTIKIKVDVDGQEQDWLLLFKNETHNHPTEIEPFGGAATCIGGCIRDPLSGRGYVYQAMRVTGGSSPLVPIEDTIPGKLPQRKILRTSARGNSSYGNQIGLATGLVDEIYHDGYMAKHLEIGAVVGAAPASHVRREVPAPGDVIVLLGGRTGRDGCGGATGSSKSHNAESLESCGAEVQKGNAPEERKLQRLFRDGRATRLIKRCNDFGAGGVSVAIGELADGLSIDLDAVPKKYEGLSGTELAISESQERMAVVLDPDDVQEFCKLAEGENLEATIVANVTLAPRLVMSWRGKKICDIAREFLDSNGASKTAFVHVASGVEYLPEVSDDFVEAITQVAGDLNVCSKRGLSEMFDSTVGAGSVLMPFGGAYQLTPTQVMAAKIPVLHGHTDTCSVMSYGYNPMISEADPYKGAYLAVVESVSKLVAAGAPTEGAYLTFQEYFERLGKDEKRWGKPLASLLGAFEAQTGLGIAAIGGKDSMSGSFEKIDVPPTLVSFAINTCDAKCIISPEFKKANSNVYIITPDYDNGLPTIDSLKATYSKVEGLISQGKVVSAYTPTFGGIAEGIIKMSLGNKVGFEFDSAITHEMIFNNCYGAFIIEALETLDETLLGKTSNVFAISGFGKSVDGEKTLDIFENKLESVYHLQKTHTGGVKNFEFKAKKRTTFSKVAQPRILIPVFPGTNCEYDTARAFERAGGTCDVFVINNLSSSGIEQSAVHFSKLLADSQILFLPGGFSGGDEPDGSGKFITAFLRNPIIAEQISYLLENRDGLIGGICNGFQALIKLGLVPYGQIRDMRESAPTLTHNRIGRHQSRLVYTKVTSNKSPWLSSCEVGDVHLTPISHGEGRFICTTEELLALEENGQIATQYVDASGTRKPERLGLLR